MRMNTSESVIKLEKAIAKSVEDKSKDSLISAMEAARIVYAENIKLIVPIDIPKVGQTPAGFKFIPRKLRGDDGTQWLIAYTNTNEKNKGDKCESANLTLTELFDIVIKNASIKGLFINPWGKPLSLNKDMIKIIIRSNRQENNDA